MKKFLLIAIAFFAFMACDDEDTSDLRDELKNQGDRLEMLENEVEALKVKIEGLNLTFKAITEMLNGGFITAVEEVTDGDKSGHKFTIRTFDEAAGAQINTYTIWNGESIAGLLGVEKDEENGQYYWTLGSEPLLDADGNKVYTSTTPKLKIEEDGNLYISYDGGATYEELGVFNGTVTAGSNIQVEVKDGKVIIKQEDKDDIEIPITPANTLGIKFKGITNAGMRVVKNGVYIVEYELENASANANVKVEMLNGTNFEVESLLGENKFKVTAKGQDASDVVLVHVYDGTVCRHTSFNITPDAAIKAVMIVEPEVSLTLEDDEVTQTVNLTLPNAPTGNVTFSIIPLGTLPAGAYTIPSTVTVTNGQGTFDIVVDRTSLTAGKAYTLQLVFSGEDASYQVDGSVMMTTGVLAKIQLNEGNYIIWSTHSGKTGTQLCDDDDATYWESEYYSYSKMYGDPIYGMYVDIVLPRKLVAVQFKYLGNPKMLALGVKNDGWRLLGTQVYSSTGETPVYYNNDIAFETLRFGMPQGNVSGTAGNAPTDGSMTGYLGGGPYGDESYSGTNYVRLYKLDVWGLWY